MSQSWPPQQPPSPRERTPQPPYGPPNSGYGQRDAGYGQYEPGYGQYEQGYGQRDSGYGQYEPGGGQRDPGYGYPPQQQGGQPGGWPSPQGEPWSRGPTSQGRGPYSQYPAYPGGQYGAPYGYGEPPAPPRRSGNWLLPVVVVLLLLLVGGGAGYVLTHGKALLTSTTAHGTPTAAATTTPGIPAGFRLYTDNSAHVQFVMPHDWIAHGSISASSGLALTSPDLNKAFEVLKAPGTADNGALATAFLDGVAGSSGTVANRVGPTQVSLAGETWAQESADVTRNGETVHVVALVASHSGATYLLGYLAPPSVFADANTRYFQPMVQSFTFLA